jgi:hypothetical protein
MFEDNNYAPSAFYFPIPRICEKIVVVQNKMNLLLKIFWILHQHYNFLQITQIKDYLQKLLNV